MLYENKEFKLVNDRFPHISEALELLWGTKEYAAYIYKLLTDTRDGKRNGFPHEVADALFKLSNFHNDEFPEFVVTIDIWSHNDSR